MFFLYKVIFIIIILKQYRGVYIFELFYFIILIIILIISLTYYELYYYKYVI